MLSYKCNNKINEKNKNIVYLIHTLSILQLHSEKKGTKHPDANPEKPNASTTETTKQK